MSSHEQLGPKAHSSDCPAGTQQQDWAHAQPLSSAELMLTVQVTWPQKARDSAFRGALSRPKEVTQSNAVHPLGGQGL